MHPYSGRFKWGESGGGSRPLLAHIFFIRCLFLYKKQTVRSTSLCAFATDDDGGAATMSFAAPLSKCLDPPLHPHYLGARSVRIAKQSR